MVEKDKEIQQAKYEAIFWVVLFGAIAAFIIYRITANGPKHKAK